MAAQPRNRPTLTVTIKAAHMERLRALVGRLPAKGANLSGIVDEMLALTLPMFENAAEAYQAALRPDGTTDDDVMRDRFAAYLGQQMLRMVHNSDDEEDETD
jgi:hypothetical protein